MTIFAGNIHGLTLVASIARTAHQVDARVTVNTAHSGQVMDISGHALDVSAIRQSQDGAVFGRGRNINLCQPGVAQGDSPGSGVTTKTSCVGDSGCQSGMRVFRVLANVTCETATTTIPHYVVTVLSLRLTNVATGTLLTQHRVRNAVPEILQTVSLIWPNRFAERLPCYLDHAVRGMHHAFCNRGNPVGMATAAGALGVCEFTGKCNQAVVRITFNRCRVVTGMAGDATTWRKRMGSAKAILLIGMTLHAGAADRRTLLREQVSRPE